MYDIIARSATTKSHRQRAENSLQCRMSILNQQLRALRERSGLSMQKLADEMDMRKSTYAAYEDPRKFKKNLLPVALATKIADVLEQHGVPRAEVLALTGCETGAAVPPQSWAPHPSTILRFVAAARRALHLAPDPEDDLERLASALCVGIERLSKEPAIERNQVAMDEVVDAVTAAVRRLPPSPSQEA